MAMTTTSLADAKNRLSEIVASAQRTHERTTITKNGRPVAAIIAIEDLESLEETLELLSDPTAFAAVRAAGAELAGDDYLTAEEMQELMVRRAEGPPPTAAGYETESAEEQ